MPWYTGLDKASLSSLDDIFSSISAWTAPTGSSVFGPTP